MEFDAYDALVRSIYQAAAGDAPLSLLFQRLRAATGADAAGVSVYDSRDEVITHTLIGSNRRVSQSLIDQIRPLNEEASARLVTSAKPARARRFTDIVPEGRLRGSRWYLLQTQLTGVGHGIVGDQLINGLRVRLFVTRSSMKHNFDATEVDLLERVSAHVRVAFQRAIHRFSPRQPARDLVAVVYHEQRIAACFLSGPQSDHRRIATLGLSPAETRVLEAMSRGFTQKEGAAALGIGVPTLKTHLRRIYAKTGTHRLSELICKLQDAARAER